MNFKLKRLQDQVIVITGASSGIGLATARLAVERGARVVLSSRNKAELERICSEINRRAKERKAICLECDVADANAVKRVADIAIQEFGGFDTWVNNAGLSIYGRLTEIPMAEKRRLFDVNFWGVVNGCRAAIPHLRTRGGALINIGSIASDRAIPIQGIYTASKHAVKAYTDALRMELEAEGAPISVTLVKPAAIDTPFPEHAVNHMDHHPKHTPPVYAPEVVARAILDCAENPRRDIHVGGSSKVFTFLETFLPRLGDMLMESGMMESHQSSAKLDNVKQDPALYVTPRKEGQVRGHYPGHVAKTSAYTSASLHPASALMGAVGAGLATASVIGLLQLFREDLEIYRADQKADRKQEFGNRDQVLRQGEQFASR